MASSSSSGHRSNVGDDPKPKAGGGADDTAARIGALEAQIARLTRVVELNAVMKELPPPGPDGGSTAASAASAGAASVGDKKSAGLVTKLDEATRYVPASAGSAAAAAARRVPKGATAAAPPRGIMPVADDKEVAYDDDSVDDGAGSGSAQTGAAGAKARRLGAGILESASLHGSFRTWCRNVEWKNARNKHEALGTSMALDSLLADGVSAELDGMEMLMRRLAALQLADATKQYSVTETMSFVPFGGTSLLRPDDMERELAKATRLQKMLQPTVASVFNPGNGRGGGRGAGRGRGGNSGGGAGGGAWKRGGGGFGGGGGIGAGRGSPSSGAASDQ
jgi:hypothetical protein